MSQPLTGSHLVIFSIILFFAGLVGCLLIVPRVRLWAGRKRLVDRPDVGRKKHKRAVPRVGGLALFVVFFFQAAIWLLVFKSSTTPETVTLFVTASLMFLLGFRDDLKALGARKKLLFQILIASIAYVGGLRVELLFFKELGIWNFPITVFWLVATTNIINLIDGIDGLAAGVSMFLMITLAVMGNGDPGYTVFCLGMAGALLGFLYYNFPPAKIFLGDGGAYFLGYLIGGISILTSNKVEVAASLIAPFLALGLPLLDTTLAIVRRTVRGMPVFYGDREHIHHRLVDLGFSSQKAVLILYCICALLSLGALTVFFSQGRLFPLVLGLAFTSALLIIQQLGYVKSYSTLTLQLTRSYSRRQEIKATLELLNLYRIAVTKEPDISKRWLYMAVIFDRLGFDSAEFQPFSAASGHSPFLWRQLLPYSKPGLLSPEYKLHVLECPIHKGKRHEYGHLTLKKFMPDADIPHFQRLCHLIVMDVINDFHKSVAKASGGEGAASQGLSSN